MTNKHPVKISYDGSLEKLAEEIGDLRYDVLINFLDLLSKKIYKDADKDGKKFRVKLSQSLFEACDSLDEARVHIEKALKISRPYMEEEFEESNS
jgi:hypothetical protein